MIRAVRNNNVTTISSSNRPYDVSAGRVYKVSWAPGLENMHRVDPRTEIADPMGMGRGWPIFVCVR